MSIERFSYFCGLAGWLLRSGVSSRLTSLLSHNNCRISLLIFIGTFWFLLENCWFFSSRLTCSWSFNLFAGAVREYRIDKRAYSLVTRSNVIFDCFHTKELCRIIFANTELASPSIFLLIFWWGQTLFYRSQDVFRVLKSYLRFLRSVVHTKKLFQVLVILRALLMFLWNPAEGSCFILT